jgi:methanogenic corrinoid protein MtbC1
MVCGLFRAKGWAVHYLGADVAPRFLLEAVQLHRPDAILLSAKLPAHRNAVKAAIDVLISGPRPEAIPPIVVGGRVAVEHPDALRNWGAIPVTDDHPAAAIRAVASAVPPLPAAGPAGKAV